MESQRAGLGAASARWNDYVGTASADDAETVFNRPSLYELAHINRDLWMILAIDMLVSEGTASVNVYAIDRLKYAVAGQADVLTLAGKLGEVPVVRFPVAEPHVDELINNGFKRIAISLVSRGVSVSRARNR